MNHTVIDPIHDVPAGEATGVVGRLLRWRAEARGLDETQMEALLHLHGAPAARLTVHELGEHLGPGADLIAVVSALLAEGLVAPAGQPSCELVLSVKGKRLAGQVVSEVWVLLSHTLRPSGLTPARFIARLRKELT
jgi:hypothetical protein